MDSIETAVRQAFSLGGARVEPARNVIIVGERIIRLEPKVMDVLVALAEAGGGVVPRELLIERIWNVEFGGDESVSRAVSLLRKALKDAGLGDGAIETVTKRGYRLAIAPSIDAEPATARPPGAAAPPARSGGLRRTGVIAAAVFFLAALGIAGAYLRHGGRARADEPPVVAVLPFDDLSEKGDQKWFAEGLADELIDNLATAPGLTVISRTSSFRFADIGLDARVIGDRLGARYLVEGGVRRDGDRFRISAALVDSKNQATIWSKTYARDSSGIFETQAEIARDIARALNVRIAKGAIDEIMKRTNSPQAFDAFLLGHAFQRAEGADNIKRASDQFRLAVELDPRFVDAWMSLAASLSVYDFWHPDDFAAARAERDAAVDRALELAPKSPNARFFKAWSTLADGDAPAAFAAIDALLPADDRSGCGTRVFIDNITLGRIDPAYGACLDGFVKTDPYSLAAAQDAQFMGHLIGRDDIAEREYERSKTLPGGPGLGEIYAFLRAFRADDRAAARAHFRAMIDFMPAKIRQFEEVYEAFDDDARVRDVLNDARIDPANQDPTRLVMIAKLLAIYGDAEGAADALRRHFLDVGGTWWQELWMPEHAQTRRQAAFKDIIRGKKIDAYFRQQGRWNSFCEPTSDADFACR